MNGSAFFFLVMPARYRVLPMFLDTVAKEYAKDMKADCCRWSRQSLHEDSKSLPYHSQPPLPPYSPRRKPSGNIWRNSIKNFKNFALKSWHEVNDKLDEAALYIERNSKLVSRASVARLLRRTRPSCPCYAPVSPTGGGHAA